MKWNRKSKFWPYLIKVKKIVKKLPQEIINTAPIRKYVDVLFLDGNDEINIVEFQTGGIKTKDLKRFMVYNALIAEKHNEKVNVIIVYTEKVKTVCYKNGTLIFKPIVYSLKDFDGDKILKRIRYKIENNITLTGDDLNKLEFLPLFKSRLKPGEILFETANLTNQLIDIPQSQIDHIKTGQVILANWFFHDELDKKKIWKVIEMKTSMFRFIYDELEARGLEEGMKKGFERGMEQGIERGIEQGIEKGMEKGMEEGILKGELNSKKEVARKMLNLNYSMDEIINITGLTKKEITKL